MAVLVSGRPFLCLSLYHRETGRTPKEKKKNATYDGQARTRHGRGQRPRNPDQTRSLCFFFFA
ncbi:hypothetical protein GQ607_000137 [Colletotrichum asianum]|uniref:Uncharacterized protein n=1 Tax=Colletotrichum asianum TaxID=702518 RepID=A0A8H3WTU4_9PEZI|nr:hypothetical protein GQ607_000137 [Colletotrichum asianum]